MKTQQLVEEVVRLLNRPEEDDLFDYPTEYHAALTRAYRHFRMKVAQVYPYLIYERATVTSSDGGNTFTLADDHYGEMQVWDVNGPPNGYLLTPSDPYGGNDFWMEGRNIKMIYPYKNDLTVLYVPATTTALDDANDPTLPEYFFEPMANQAAAYLARKPGYLGDPEVFFLRARNEWSGDGRDPSDNGILGSLRRQSAQNAYRTTAVARPWWRGIA